jgi:hypothetical protein
VLCFVKINLSCSFNDENSGKNLKYAIRRVTWIFVGKLIISDAPVIRTAWGYDGISDGNDVKRTESIYAC